MDTEQLSMTKKTLVGVQFLFVAFGATVLVPLLIGIDPATALFTAGLNLLIRSQTPYPLGHAVFFFVFVFVFVLL